MSDSTEQESKYRSQYQSVSRFLLFGGILLIVFGGVHAVSFIQEAIDIELYDALFNGALGILLLMTFGLFRAKNKIAIYMVLFGVATAIAYAMLVGRGLNYIVLIGGAILLFLMIRLRNADLLQ